MKVLSVVCLLLALVVSIQAGPAGPRHVRAERQARLSKLGKHHGHEATADFPNWANMQTPKDVKPKEELYASAPLYVWPQPASFSRGNTVREFATQFKMTGEPSFDDLNQAIARYSRMVFDHRVTGEPAIDAITELNIVIADPNAPLQLDTDGQLTHSMMLFV